MNGPAHLSYGLLQHGEVTDDGHLNAGPPVETVACACGWTHELGADRDGDTQIVLQHLTAEHPA